MAVNLSKNGPALTAAYNEVVDEKSGTNWWVTRIVSVTLTDILMFSLLAAALASQAPCLCFSSSHHRSMNTTTVYDVRALTPHAQHTLNLPEIISSLCCFCGANNMKESSCWIVHSLPPVRSAWVQKHPNFGALRLSSWTTPTLFSCNLCPYLTAELGTPTVCDSESLWLLIRSICSCECRSVKNNCRGTSFCSRSLVIRKLY